MTENLQPWVLMAIAALVCAVLTPLVRIWTLRSELVDLPGERRSHAMPTPRGGGVAIIAAILIALVIGQVPIQSWWFPMLFISALGLVGWLDDRADLSATIRLAAQTVMVGAALWMLGGIASVTVLGQTLPWPWLWTIAGAVAAVWLINLHNFMDGSDGLASMQGCVSAAVLSVLLRGGETDGSSLFGLAVAGAFLGFLLWNRPPARIFMGDVGSMALGSAIAWLALVGVASGKVSIAMAFIVTSVFVVDATATLGLRAFRGEQWYTAHRRHAYQRLIVAGWSHGAVLVLYGLANFCLVLPVVLLAQARPELEMLLAALLGLVLVTGWWIIQSTTRMEKP